MDKGHRLALIIAVGNWHEATGYLWPMLHHNMPGDGEAAEIAQALDALDQRMQALLAARLRQYAKPRINGVAHRGLGGV